MSLLAFALALSLHASPEVPCAGMPVDTPLRREWAIRCVADYHLGGGPYGARADKAVRVARCEAYPWLQARLVDHGNLGVFQMRYWRERWRRYGKPLGVPNRPLSLIANAHVALAMVKDYGGWSHWSCGDA